MKSGKRSSGSTDYRVHWLRARDARDVARIERATHSAAQRSGLAEIAEDLLEADLEGANLSLGLYLGKRMVGYLLVYLERDRQRIPGYMEIDAPEGVDLSGTGAFIADYAVLQRHRRAAGLLLGRLFSFALQRGGLVGLPADIVCIEPLMQYWQNHSRIAARFGYAVVTNQRFQTAQMPQPMYWLTFRPTRTVTWERQSATLAAALAAAPMKSNESEDLRIAVLQSAADWPLLESAWNDLVLQTPDSTVFQTYEYLRSWWRHIGWPSELRIIVASRGERIVALAPMYCAPTWLFGRQLRYLTFLGQPSEADRPTLLADPADTTVATAIARYIVSARDLWDCIVLYEQNPQSPFYRAMADQLRTAGAITAQIDVPVCAFVAIEGTWDSYLASRSKSFRKNIRRRMSQLEQHGTVTFQISRSPADAESMLEEYLAVERASWKAGSAIGAGQSSPHQNFYRDLSQKLPAGAEMHFKILRLDGQAIAATFGILWQRCFYSLHIAHDDRFAEHSPGVVLTAYELRDAFERREYDKMDFLGGFLTNKLSWSTGGLSTVALYAYRPGWRSRLYHFVTFWLRPRLRLLLIRMNLLGPAQRLKQFIHSRRHDDG